MSGTSSMYFRAALLRKTFRGEDVLGSSLFVALTRRVGDVNTPGSMLDEPTAMGYVRQEVPYGLTYWAFSGYSEIYNVNELDFPNPTSYWGLIQGYALVDSATNGLVLATGSLVNPLRADVGFSPVVKAHGIVVGLTD